MQNYWKQTDTVIISRYLPRCRIFFDIW